MSAGRAYSAMRELRHWARIHRQERSDLASIELGGMPTGRMPRVVVGWGWVATRQPAAALTYLWRPWPVITIIAAVVVAICAVFLVAVVAARADAHRDSTSVNGPGVVIQPPAFSPFAINTAKGTACPGVHGEALCVPGPQGKAALKAFDAWPTTQALKTALGAATKDAEAQRAAAEAQAKLRLKHEDEIEALRAALEAQRERATQLQRAIDGSWWRTLLKVGLPVAGAISAGYLIGRYAR